MKIELRQLTEGQQVILREALDPSGLDLEVEGIRVVSQIEIMAEVIKIQDTLDARVSLNARASALCSRCLADVIIKISKGFRQAYPVATQDTFIDITDDIRQEIILNYPLKPLCMISCKGLCSKCGKNLNEGPCDCEALK